MPYRDDQARTGRLLCRHSNEPGELLAAGSLKPGEIAMNAADGKLMLPGQGGIVDTITATRSPNRNMVISEASWPVIQSSIQATLQTTNTAAYEEKVCPTPTGWNSNCMAGPVAHAWDGKVVVFWYDNAVKTTPTKPFVWDVESNTIDDDYFDDSALRPWYSVFDPVMASDGAIVCPGFTNGYGPVRLLFKDGSCFTFPADAPGLAVANWYNNGTFFMNGTRTRVGITPDGGNPWIAYYNANTGKMERVANNWNDKGTSPALRAGITMADGRAWLQRGRYNGTFKVAIWDQAAGEVVEGASVPVFADTAAVLSDGNVLIMPLANPHTDIITPYIYNKDSGAVTAAATFDQTAYGSNAAFYGLLLTPLGSLAVTGSSGSNPLNILEYDPLSGVLGEFGTQADTNRRQHQLSYVGIPGGWVTGINGVQGAAPFAWRAWDQGFDLEIINSAFMGKPT